MADTSDNGSVCVDLARIAKTILGTLLSDMGQNEGDEGMKNSVIASAIHAVSVATLLLAIAVGSSAQAADYHPACETPKKYMEYVQQGKFVEVGNLFAPNAVFFAPNGDVFRGAEDIKKFYIEVAAPLKVIVEPKNFIGDKNECFFEIWTKSKLNEEGIWVPDPNGEFVRGAIDHFTVDDEGRVLELVAHSSPLARMIE